MLTVGIFLIVFAVIVGFFILLEDGAFLMTDKALKSTIALAAILAVAGTVLIPLGISSDKQDKQQDLSRISDPSLRNTVEKLAEGCNGAEVNNLVNDVYQMQSTKATLVFGPCPYPTISLVTDRGVNSSIDERLASAAEAACTYNNGSRDAYRIDQKIKVGEQSTILVIGCE